MLKGKDIISALDLTHEDIMDLIDLAEILRGKPMYDIAKDRILATAFFEPSTRTRLSFTFAMTRLGGTVIDMGPEQVTSRVKGETFQDTMRMIDGYCPDLIVIRHPVPGSAAEAARIADAPVVNAGDGTNEHPTQALTDLYTIWREYHGLDGLTIAIVGDLRYGRTPSSLSYAISKFQGNKIIYVSPRQLRIRREVLEKIKGKVEYEEIEGLDEMREPIHVIYMTRVQRERFEDPREYERLKGSYMLTRDVVDGLKGNPIVMHPLPRIIEIPEELDGHPRSRYFQQAQNGMYIRMAIITRVLDLRPP